MTSFTETSAALDQAAAPVNSGEQGPTVVIWL